MKKKNKFKKVRIWFLEVLSCNSTIEISLLLQSHSLMIFVGEEPGKGPFNNYVDKMEGEGVKKYLLLSTLRE